MLHECPEDRHVFMETHAVKTGLRHLAELPADWANQEEGVGSPYRIAQAGIRFHMPHHCCTDITLCPKGLTVEL